MLGMVKAFWLLFSVSTFLIIFLKTASGSVIYPPPFGKTISMEFCVPLRPCLIEPPAYMELRF